jgi:pilus assembly protein CpaB
MTRTTRTIVVIGVATLMAAIASLGVYAAVSRIPVREIEVAHQYIAVAVKTLPMGTRLQAVDLKLVAWPSSSPVAGAFEKIEDVVDRGLVSAVVANEPVIESKLAPKESGAGLPPTIPTGMRAMSVKVNEVIGVAGFVVPGTRVDLVVTVRAAVEDGKPMSRTVVGNVLVLTSGTRYDQEQAKDGEALPATVVTLAVTPIDAERIALAAAEGQISLALRNPLDHEPVDTPGVKIEALMNGGKAAPAPAPAARRTSGRAAPPVVVVPAAPPKPYTVETIRAAKRADEVVH